MTDTTTSVSMAKSSGFSMRDRLLRLARDNITFIIFGLITLFFVLALALALLNRGASQQNRSILDSPPPASAPAAPALPAAPAVPNN